MLWSVGNPASVHVLSGGGDAVIAANQQQESLPVTPKLNPQGMRTVLPQGGLDISPARKEKNRHKKICPSTYKRKQLAVGDSRQRFLGSRQRAILQCFPGNTVCKHCVCVCVTPQATENDCPFFAIARTTKRWQIKSG